MDAVPLGEGLPMILPPLQQLGFGTSRWRLQGNATLGLRAGGRGHHLFFLAGQESAPGTNQHTTGGQSMSALPRYIRRQLAPLSRARHQPQCPDIGRCSRSLCGRARAGRPEDCLCADRSTSPSSAGGNGSEKLRIKSGSGDPFRDKPRVLACRHGERRVST